MRADLPSGTVTLLFTDIEGSTRLLHQLGPDGYAEALAEHRRLLRDAFTTHGGVEVDTQGDAFFVAFPTASGAATAALEAQDALAPGPIRVRMGLHTGTPTLTAEGYVGVDVHRGARVAALAHGAQVLLTQATAALLSDELEAIDLGAHRIKDFDTPTPILQLGTNTFPPLRTPGAVDLPIPVTRFIGRERELYDAVTTWIDRDPRVLTVLGPGGTGKTRFALELSRLLAEEADGGTTFIPLASVRDARRILPLVAERLGALTPDPHAIAARIGERRTHLLLDNLEQLLPHAATPLAELLTAVPQLRLLVTSREPLRISGETELELPPLDDHDGSQLFLERARAIRPEITDTPAVHELVRRLDGLPLALELAAARVKLLAPDRLLERLEGRLDLLKGARDLDERHATLRATIAWSHDLLDHEEQAAFARLSVFRGGFSLESAEHVCDVDIDVLASLLDKSLLRRRTEADGSDRLWMLETIRAFAREQLGSSGEEQAVCRRHAAAMYDLAVAANLSAEATGPYDHASVLDAQDDLRAALDWASEHDRPVAIALAVALENFWATQGGHEGAERLAALLADEPEIDGGLLVSALRVHGSALDTSGDRDLAYERYRQAYAIGQARGDRKACAILEHRLAVHAARLGDRDRARELLDGSLRTAQELGFVKLETQVIGSQGGLLAAHDPARAFALLRRSAELAASSGFVWWQAGQLMAMLELDLRRGRLDEAERWGREAIAVLAPIDDRAGVEEALVGLARVAHARGDLRRAGLLWGAVDREAGLGKSLALSFELGDLPTERDPDFVAAVESGRSMELEDAVAAALDEAQTVP